MSPRPRHLRYCIPRLEPLEERALLTGLTFFTQGFVTTPENVPALVAPPVATISLQDQNGSQRGDYEVRITAEQGQLFAESLPGLSVDGSGTNRLELNGPIDAVQVFFRRGIRFEPTAFFSGPGKLVLDAEGPPLEPGQPPVPREASASLPILINPVAQPPLLRASDVEGDVAVAIPLVIAAGVVDPDGSESVRDVRIKGLPPGTLFNVGTEPGPGELLVPADQLPRLALTFPNVGTFDLTVEARSVDTALAPTGNTITTVSNPVTVNFRVTVKPIKTPPGPAPAPGGDPAPADDDPVPAPVVPRVQVPPPVPVPAAPVVLPVEVPRVPDSSATTASVASLDGVFTQVADLLGAFGPPRTSMMLAGFFGIFRKGGLEEIAAPGVSTSMFEREPSVQLSVAPLEVNLVQAVSALNDGGTNPLLFEQLLGQRPNDAIPALPVSAPRQQDPQPAGDAVTCSGPQNEETPRTAWSWRLGDAVLLAAMTLVVGSQTVRRTWRGKRA